MWAQLLVIFTRLMFGAYPRWIGVQPEPRQRVYFANHGSHLDTVTLWAALPPALRRRTRPVAARDYWGGGLRAWVARHVLNAVLIDRQREDPDQDPLQPLHEALQQGDSLILFPEGTRTQGEELGRFKSGLYRLALAHPQVQPVAVYLDNARRSLPKGSLLPVPLICTARFGPVIAPGPDESAADYLQRARAAVMELA